MTPREWRAVRRATRWRSDWERVAWYRWAQRIFRDGLETCPALHGRVACGATLESRVVAEVTVPFCPRCERKRQGRCVDCGSPRERPTPLVTFCAACARRRCLATQERSQRQTADTRAAHALAKYHALAPAERRARNASGALYRMAAPHVVERHIARQRERRQRDPALRQRCREHGRRSRERVALGVAKRERYTAAGERLCRTATCDAVLRHTKARYCPTCHAARVAAARRALLAPAPTPVAPEVAA
jgi:hypothetical protein